MDKQSFIENIRNSGYDIYEESVDCVNDVYGAIAKKDDRKYLAICTDGCAIAYHTVCTENASILMKHFPYTVPSNVAGHKFTMGLGDRLGCATVGQLNAIRNYDIFPVLAQQSIRELTLTHRSFEDVIACAAFGVFEAGYKKGYGADGDHLKTKEEIAMAINQGCNMITLDCSNYIKDRNTSDEHDKNKEAYYYDKYLNKGSELIGSISKEELNEIICIFDEAICFAEECYSYIKSITNREIAFELSIDEAERITSLKEHYIIANELYSKGVKLTSLAPHFTGAFEKGIDYVGNVDEFEKDLKVHQKIASYFGYKLSLHSGSDKFTIFPAFGRETQGTMHVKTAGTHWLEAVRVIARKNPQLFRKVVKFALDNRAQVEKYYHISTTSDQVRNIDIMTDEELPILLEEDASRQLLHIIYGPLLDDEVLGREFKKCLFENEKDYYKGLQEHTEKHIRLLVKNL